MNDRADVVRAELVSLLPRLRRFARALTRQADDADDLVQAALERALRGLGQWQIGTSLDAWVFRIMKNAWIDESRARASRAKRFAPEEAGLNTSKDGAAQMAAHMDVRAAERAMNELPEEQRLAVALVLVAGFSYAEAAETLQIPIGTLTSRLARGRANIERAILGEA